MQLKHHPQSSKAHLSMIQAALALSSLLARGLNALLFDPLESRDLPSLHPPLSLASKGRVGGSSLMAEADRRRQNRGGRSEPSGRQLGEEEDSSSEGEEAEKDDAGAKGRMPTSAGLPADLNLSLPPCYKASICLFTIPS